MLEDSVVIIYLKEPKERIWGILRSVSPTGLFVQGIDINSFDQWLNDFYGKEELIINLSKIFFPMHRVEKILADEPAGSIPSLSQRFEAKMGKKLTDFFPAPLKD